MIIIEISDHDLASIPEISLFWAEDYVWEENNKIDYGPKWMLLTTQYGQFVARITHAQGCNGPNPIPFSITYELAYRIQPK